MTVSELVARLQFLIAEGRIKADYAIAIWQDERVGKEAYDLVDRFDIDREGEFISFYHA